MSRDAKVASMEQTQRQSAPQRTYEAAWPDTFASLQTADADEFIDYIVDGAGRMQRLINDLLSYSRVGSLGKGFAPTDCAAVLRTVSANLRAAIEERGAVIISDPLPTVMADETQPVQLFQNLLGNAIKFRSEKSPIISIGVERRGNNWQFRLGDNGIGIEPQCMSSASS